MRRIPVRLAASLRKVQRILPGLAVVSLLALIGSGAQADTIVDARYAVPTDRYGHFALGQPHEYARLQVRTGAGHTLHFDLPDHEVFEDLAPRIVGLAAGEPTEILAIVSGQDDGARLVMLHLSGGRLEISAQSAPIGTPMRWLNPVGVVDLDGDGRAEIAAVITPHIGGTLKVYRKQSGVLEEVSSLRGFSNHVYRSPALGLSTPMSIAGKMRLLVPDATRHLLRVIGMEGGRLVETGRCALEAPVVGEIKVLSSSEVSVVLRSGRQVIVPGRCPG